MADFLIVNGVRLDVKVLTGSRDLVVSGDLSMAGGGEVLDQRRQGRRRWRMTTTCKSRREARAVQALIDGYAHVIPFDGDLAASTSLSPSSVPSLGIQVRHDGGFSGGCVIVEPGSTLGYAEATYGGEEWTAFARIVEISTMTSRHIARRNDGACFVDGVRVAPPNTNTWPISYTNGPDRIDFNGHGVAGGAQQVQFSDAVIFKGWMSDAWIAQIAAHDGSFGPGPLVAAEGSMIDSVLGIYANGAVEGGAFVQHGSMQNPRAEHPEDQGWQNNELEITFSLVEDDRVPALDAIPIGSPYAPMTSRARIATGVAAVVTDNAQNGPTSVLPTSMEPGPSGDTADLWPRFDGAPGLVLNFNANVATVVDALNSRFSLSFWLRIPSAPQNTDVIGAWGVVGKREWKVELDSTNRLGVIVLDESASGSFIRITSTDPVPVDQWIHVVVVHDTVGVSAGAIGGSLAPKVALFLNGLQLPVTTSLFGTFIHLTDQGRSMGIPNGESVGAARIGIAHIAAFPLRALTRADIRILYRLGRRGAWLRRV